MNKMDLKFIMNKRTILVLFSVYFVIMVGLSVLLISQQMKIEGLTFGSSSGYIHQDVGRILRDNMDEQHQITDLAKLQRELIPSLAFYSDMGIAIAVYSRDYDLLFHTKDSWVCSFTEYSVGNTQYTGYAYLSPWDWFSEEEIEELEYYLNAELEPKQEGDLAHYYVSLNGFFLKDDEILPTEIVVTPMYATEFDENGKLSGGANSSNGDDIIYHAKIEENVKGLPYFSYGSIQRSNTKAKEQQALRDSVLDIENLWDTEKRYEKISPVTYRYYSIMSYENRVLYDEEKNEAYGEFWTVCATEVNLLKQSAKALLIMWASCLIPFIAAAWTLSNRSDQIHRNMMIEATDPPVQE